jgi:cell wall-associated NlpC family hydrolase
MQITVDTNELAQIAHAVQDTTAQLGGMSVDIRKRIASVPLDELSRYGLNPAQGVSDAESAAAALVIDSAALEELGLQMENFLARTLAQQGGGALATLQATMPDLWWFSMGARQPTAPTGATSAGAATGGLPQPATTAVQAIIQAAHELGVDPILALADATKETGRLGDVASIDPGNTTGDGGTSFGIYQLHWGGELNDLGTSLGVAKARALDPLTNARTALKRFADVAHANPSFTPGQVAAAAQRPANPGAYAADVDRAYQMIKATGIPVTPAAPTPVGGDTSAGASIVASARAWIGTPYLLGGGHAGGIVSPGAEDVDCSGLVRQVFGENHFNVNGTAATIYASGAPVPDLASAKPGDLLFWGTTANVHHVAIYVGDGKMVEAPHRGSIVREVAVYGGDFLGIRRVLS